MEINAQRLWNRLHQLGQIGVDPQGGVTRWTFTDADTQAKNWLISEMKAAGLDVHEDPVGNVIGVYNPGGSPLAPVLFPLHRALPAFSRLSGTVGGRGSGADVQGKSNRLETAAVDYRLPR
ncbi:MAG: hypothetical protein ACLSFJ_08780 [Holdemania filiformis]